MKSPQCVTEAEEPKNRAIRSVTRERGAAAMVTMGAANRSPASDHLSANTGAVAAPTHLIVPGTHLVIDVRASCRALAFRTGGAQPTDRVGPCVV